MRGSKDDLATRARSRGPTGGARAKPGVVFGRVIFAHGALGALLLGSVACGGVEDCPTICRQIGAIAGSTTTDSVCDVAAINEQDDDELCRVVSTQLFD